MASSSKYKFIAFALPVFIVLAGPMFIRYQLGTTDANVETESTPKETLPDIETVISSSISSVQKQSQLLVLTARMNATASSTIKELGMEAWQIDVATSEAQYLVNLHHVNTKAILVDGNGINIMLPKTALVIKQLPSVPVESKDNDSWLFTWRSDTKERLTRHNQQKLKSSFLSQSQEQKAVAYTEAQYQLERLFTAPIKAAGLPHYVTITFR